MSIYKKEYVRYSSVLDLHLLIMFQRIAKHSKMETVCIQWHFQKQNQEALYVAKIHFTKMFAKVGTVSHMPLDSTYLIILILQDLIQYYFGKPIFRGNRVNDPEEKF